MLHAFAENSFASLINKVSYTSSHTPSVSSSNNYSSAFFSNAPSDYQSTTQLTPACLPTSSSFPLSSSVNSPHQLLNPPTSSLPTVTNQSTRNCCVSSSLCLMNFAPPPPSARSMSSFLTPMLFRSSTLGTSSQESLSSFSSSANSAATAWAAARAVRGAAPEAEKSSEMRTLRILSGAGIMVY